MDAHSDDAAPVLTFESTLSTPMAVTPDVTKNGQRGHEAKISAADIDTLDRGRINLAKEEEKIKNLSTGDICDEAKNETRAENDGRINDEAKNEAIAENDGGNNDEVLYCICKTPWDMFNPVFMIECHECHDWFHGSCVEITEVESQRYAEWYCPSCANYKGPPLLRKGGLRNSRSNREVGYYMKLNESPDDHTSDLDMVDIDYGTRLKMKDRQDGYFTDGSKCLTIFRESSDITSFTKEEYCNKNGFNNPVLFDIDCNDDQALESLGLKVPRSRCYDKKITATNCNNSNVKDDENDRTTTKREKFTIKDISILCGKYRMLTVIDVATQCPFNMTLKEWVDYMKTPLPRRKRILNIISFEFSRTPLSELIRPPQFVKNVDFVDLYWPKSSRRTKTKSSSSKDSNYESQSIETKETSSKFSINNNKNSDENKSIIDMQRNNESVQDETGLSKVQRHSNQHSSDDMSRPYVQKYCLMGSEGSYTDFHIDFGGTSVWYHVHTGEKIFYFIRPTKTNIQLYQKWSTSGSQEQSLNFLADIIKSSTACSTSTSAATNSPSSSRKRRNFGSDNDNCIYKVVLKERQTLLIPSGWIHAVYTSKDSLVFGGNFVHKYSIDMQMRIYDLERKMKVQKQYRFPNYESLMWYAAHNFVVKNTGTDDAMKKVNPDTNINSNNNGNGNENKNDIDLMVNEKKQERSETSAESRSKACSNDTSTTNRIDTKPKLEELQQVVDSKSNREMHPEGKQINDSCSEQKNIQNDKRNEVSSHNEGVSNHEPLHVLRGYMTLATQLRKWVQSPPRSMHQAQCPNGMNCQNVVARLENYINQFHLTNSTEIVKKNSKNCKVTEKEIDKIKKESSQKSNASTKKKKAVKEKQVNKKIAKKTTNTKNNNTRCMKSKRKRKKKTCDDENSDEENIITLWAQCDLCDEWREVKTKSSSCKYDGMSDSIRDQKRSKQQKQQQNEREREDGSQPLPSKITANANESPSPTLSSLSATSSVFCCQDVNEVCVTKATCWDECCACGEWHVVEGEQMKKKEEAERKGLSFRFTCKDFNKECEVSDE